MSVAALLLATALVLAPAPPHRRWVNVERRAPMARTRTRIRLLGAAVTAALLMTAVPATVSAAGCAVAGTAVWRRHRRAARLRRRADATVLQAALEVLVGELRIGAHPVAAFEVAAAETDGPVAASLRTVAARARLGADMAAGLYDTAASSALGAYWERLATCCALAQRHGLPVAALMRAAARDVNERERFSCRAEAGMAGARTTASVMAGLPVLGLGLGHLIGAEPVRFLTAGGFGGTVLVTGTVLGCVGLLWSDRITAGVGA